MGELPPEYTYQQFIRQRGVALKRMGVYAKAGSGKTRPIIDILIELERLNPHEPLLAAKFPCGPLLILCTGPAIATWKRQIPLWANDPELKEHIHIVRGTKKQRSKLWHQAHLMQAGIYITNYSVFYHDFRILKDIHWAGGVADEYHRCMLRNKSETFKRWRTLTRHWDVLLPLTGSALRKNPASMWTLFNMLRPGDHAFRSYWRFVDRYCIVGEGQFGPEILEPRNVEAFQALMDRYLAYVPEAVVAEQLPDGARRTLLAEMTKEQASVHDALVDEMIAEINDGEGIIVAGTSMGLSLKLRQLLCCPKILDESLGMGGGYEQILDHMEDEPHCVIFVPFRPACEYVVQALKAKGYDADYIRGGIGDVEQEKRVTRFKQTRGVLVCTISYAESFDLETCQSSYFLGYEHVLSMNEQAEGRTQRNNSEHDNVLWHYVKYMRTHDEFYMHDLGADLRNVTRILHRPEALIRILKGEQPDA